MRPKDKNPKAHTIAKVVVFILNKQHGWGDIDKLECKVYINSTLNWLKDACVTLFDYRFSVWKRKRSQSN